MPINKIHISDLAEKYRGQCISYLTRSSFENRWVKCANSLSSANIESFIVLRSKNLSDEAKATYELLDNGLASIKTDISLNRNNTADTYNKLKDGLITSFSVNKGGLVLIDISSFRREELLIIIFLLKNICNEFPEAKCELLYIEVENMSNDWLSRNTINIRTVLGFSGDPMQSKRTCVVAMVGHELIRAKDIIDAYDPSKLMIGRGMQDESINKDLHGRNENFYKELRAYYGRECSDFEFSLLDPLKVKNKLSELCKDERYNYVLAPLNNKISCIGAGLFALENPEVQICYSDMLEYNKIEYSKPGEYAHILDVESFWFNE